MATKKQTTLEAMKDVARKQSNYTLVTLWNRWQGDQSNTRLIPLQEVLKERGIKVKRGSQCSRQFVPDEVLAAKRGEFHGNKKYTTPVNPATPEAPAPQVVERVTPNIPVDRVVGKAGKLLLWLHTQSTWTPETVDKFLVKRTPGLKQLVALGYSSSNEKTCAKQWQKRLDVYAAYFMKHAYKDYRVQVCNVRCGATFKALVKVGRQLVELRAGVKAGEQFIHAKPVAWSDLN